jgi:hypothetical protein
LFDVKKSTPLLFGFGLAGIAAMLVKRILGGRYEVIKEDTLWKS